MMKARFKTLCLMKWGPSTVVLTGCLVSLGCSSLPKGDPALDMGIKDRGVASWYGKEFHGRVAANGEIFDMTALTAAHRKLPLGSLVRVVNLANGKQVHVRINDRGPYVIGRMLDLSHAAAAELGMVEAGTSVVHLEVIGEHRPLSSVVKHSFSSIDSIPPHMVRQQAAEGGALADALLHYQTPTPSERLFPREMLYVRRERRLAGVLAVDYVTHNGVPLVSLV
ncbi:MAG: septal ring lytic transglycosylase RlpA family protein [Nitrospiraceae bacterium]